MADYRLAATIAAPVDQTDGSKRSVYSFCMCPGGQIVPTSVSDDEVCVNGMSFSKRGSKWANSALVVTVDPGDPVLEPCFSSSSDIHQAGTSISQQNRQAHGGVRVCGFQCLCFFLDPTLKTCIGSVGKVRRGLVTRTVVPVTCTVMQCRFFFVALSVGPRPCVVWYTEDKGCSPILVDNRRKVNP